MMLYDPWFFATLFKYLLEGIAVAAAAFLIPQNSTLTLGEVLMIGFTAASTFVLLDAFSPTTGLGVRHGAGFGIGLNLVGGVPMAAGSASGAVTALAAKPL